MLLRSVAILGTALALAQCAAGPALDRWANLSPDDEVVVAYLQPENPKSGTPALQQTLVTNAVIDSETLYSSRDSDPLKKVVGTDTMQLMLDGMATAGFFDHATATPFGGASVLVVRYAGATHALAWHLGMTPADQDAYRKSLAIFLNVYNGTEAAHAGTGDATVFQKEQQRLLREGRQRVQEPPRKGTP